MTASRSHVFLVGRKDRTEGVSGFTLVELLVVVAIIGILVAMLVPSLLRAKDRVNTTYCLSNERAIGQAVHLYAGDNSGFCVPRMISHSDASLNWSGAPGYQVMPGGYTLDAYWSDQILLGQYAANTGGDNANPTYTHGSVSRRAPFICPSDRQHDDQQDASTAHLSYGMGPNFPSVSPPLGPGAPLPYWNMWKILAGPQGERASMEMVAVDCHVERFSPGPPVDPFTFYGNPEPMTNYSWNEQAPDSIYTWSKRHNGGGANVVFLDGHAEFFGDLKAAYDRGEICCHRVE